MMASPPKNCEPGTAEQHHIDNGRPSYQVHDCGAECDKQTEERSVRIPAPDCVRTRDRNAYALGPECVRIRGPSAYASGPECVRIRGPNGPECVRIRGPIAYSETLLTSFFPQDRRACSSM